MRRRSFVAALVGGAAGLIPVATAGAGGLFESAVGGGLAVAARDGEDLFGYIGRCRGGFDVTLYRQLLGAANSFKEGDRLVGVAAADAGARRQARALLGATRLGDLARHPVLTDEQARLLAASVDTRVAAWVAPWTLGQLRRFLLQSDAATIGRVLPGLSSEAIGCVVKLMSDDELVAVSSRLSHALPESTVGAAGRLGARLQPSSPTNNAEDVVLQVLDGFAHGVGDVVVGANAVGTDPVAAGRLGAALDDLLRAFGLAEQLPHAVLAPLPVQTAAATASPDRGGIPFHSLGGSDREQQAYGTSLASLVGEAERRTGRWGFYFETGQGSELASDTSDGIDLVLRESRRLGLARALRAIVARRRGIAAGQVWLHVNSVAGLFGPQVFRTRQQLVRCCLEDLVMGKLHGLTMGLDLCAAPSLGLSAAELDACLDRVVPAGPAYLVALPQRHDALVGYAGTSFQDHLRLRDKFGLRADERMERFFRSIGVVDVSGRPAQRFGDLGGLYLAYRRRKGDRRSDGVILAEASRKAQAARGRGVALAGRA